MNPDDKRKIDDPELNQDATYDKKAEEDFDDSDDFHKNDDTALENESSTGEKQSGELSAGHTELNNAGQSLNTQGQFDGNITI